MRLRTLATLFVVGLVAVGAAVAGANRNWSVHATGAAEVPPRETRAQGQAIFHLAKDGLSLDYRLIASNIDNVVAAHVHLGGPTENGPVVAFLYGSAPAGGGAQNGVLSSGTLTAADLVGPLANMPFSAFVDALRAGDTYVNVHTNDGVLPLNTGPGDFPGGEIRQQIPGD